MTTTNVEVSNHIPDDIVFSILSKLHLKSLKRFGCVCKSWSLLFDDNCFMTMFRNNLLTTDHPYYDYTSVLIQTRGGGGLHSLSGDNIVELDWPNPFPCPIQEEDNHPPSSEEEEEEDDDEESEGNHPRPVRRFSIVGSVSINGTLCLHNRYSKGELLLWNPTTNEFKFIPSSPFLSAPYYFVWPDSSQLHVGYDRVKDDYKMCTRMECAIGGVKEKSIHIWCHLTLAMNLSLQHSYPRELGIKDSWTKLFIIGPLPCLWIPIGAVPKNKLLFETKDDGLALFDLSNKTIEEIGVLANLRCGLDGLVSWGLVIRNHREVILAACNKTDFVAMPVVAETLGLRWDLQTIMDLNLS
ncbi:F-box/kelch-repeat protein at3g06240-like protein [Trifolium pratense]|uniref:F-box/kelch-repeat protein at3g06240-like protein n=1 Tax=Trifolium pratense TaxID=57577 RepID=A0A2K3NB46_TRIPR|nr:F-box/kelch-repeat protein at3g06240-like protein [Trifolium pratense]